MTGLHKKLWWIGFFGWFLDAYAEGSILFVLPFLVKPFSLTGPGVALIASSQGIGILIGSYVFSYVSDAIGRRKVFQIDLLIFALGTVLFGLSAQYYELIAFSLISGLGFSGFFAVDNAYISEFLPPRVRGKWQALMTVSFGPGFMVASAMMLVVGQVPSWIGWRIMPLAAIFAALLLFSVRRTLPESVRYLASRGKTDEANRIVRKFEASAGESYDYKGSVMSPPLAKKARASPQLLFSRNYVLVTVLFSVGWLVNFFIQSIISFLPTVFRAGLGNVTPVGLLGTVLITQLVQIAGLFSSLFPVVTIDSLGRRIVMVVGLLASIIGVVTWAYPWVHRDTVSFLYLLAPAIVLWFGKNVWFVSFAPASTELYPVEARSLAYGFQSGVGRIAAIITPFILASFTDITGFFYLIGAMGIVVTIMTVAWIPETKRMVLEISSRDEVFTPTQKEQPAAQITH